MKLLVYHNKRLVVPGPISYKLNWNTAVRCAVFLSFGSGDEHVRFLFFYFYRLFGGLLMGTLDRGTFADTFTLFLPFVFVSYMRHLGQGARYRPVFVCFMS